MKRPGLPLVLVALLLAASIAGILLTRTVPPAPRHDGPKQQTLIDDSLLATARELAASADTSDEQALSRETLRLTDHELDQEFSTKLREAAAAPLPANGPLKGLIDRVASLQSRVAAEQARVNQLAKAGDEASDDLALSTARLALDQDELEDAREDLSRQGGDPHATLERALREHENAQHDAGLPKAAMAGHAATLLQQAQQWLGLRTRALRIEAARRQAVAKAASLQREHDGLERPSGAAEADTVQTLRRRSEDRKTASELDKSIQDSQQLAGVYQSWAGVLAGRQRVVLHDLLESGALILAILLAVLLINRAVRHAFSLRHDPRRLHQLRVLATIAVQVVGAVLILIVAFGPPTQISTIIGLTTAGLTVALKDFIVAFFGWFALMGKNGIRVGDWVEIEGVGGEVIEIGLLKTTLMEMGDWANTGHPTGRRVAFVNSFAIEGHYFNFSTAGQWLWDELQVLIPADGDPYGVAQDIRATIERATETEAQEAEVEWERATRQYGMRAFSAKPAVDLRPSELGNGLTVAVRYITRAPQRYQVKARLFDAIVGLLHGAGSSAAGKAR
jgi:small-conductance mechanosensitive channel